MPLGISGKLKIITLIGLKVTKQKYNIEASNAKTAIWIISTPVLKLINHVYLYGVQLKSPSSQCWANERRLSWTCIEYNHNIWKSVKTKNYENMIDNILGVLL